MNKRKTITDSIVIGAALFAMFFGAGNMIFPPYLGFKAGTDWLWGFLGYYIADIGLAVVAILGLIRAGDYKEVLRPLGRFLGPAMMFAIVMCIGPVISIPRTAATTFELSIVPLFEGVNMPIFYVIFFLLIALLCINRSAVVDIVGKILTPLLFVGLVVLIIIGIVNPIGDITLPPRTESVVADGIEAGYQSMDVLASLIFGGLILASATDKGHRDIKAKSRVAAGAGIVAGIGLLIIYLGLTYLGACSAAFHDMHTSRTDLLIWIVGTLISGKAGLVFFSVIMGLACVSTAIALTSASAEYLSEISRGKVSYRLFVIIICAFSAVVSLAGVDSIIEFASPILTIIYPPVLVLIMLTFFGEKIKNLSRCMAACCALIFGALDVITGWGFKMPFLSHLPLSNLGLGWVIPTFAIFILGVALERAGLTRKLTKV